MDVKEAVQTAKSYVVNVLSGEDIQSVATEEVVFDNQAGAWKVTVSFFRPEKRLQGVAATLAGGTPWQGRSFKVIEINRDGAVVSMTHRTFPVSN